MVAISINIGNPDKFVQINQSSNLARGHAPTGGREDQERLGDGFISQGGLMRGGGGCRPTAEHKGLVHGWVIYFVIDICNVFCSFYLYF